MVRLWIALLIASAGGCVGVDQGFDIRDGPVLMPTLRATVDYWDAEPGADGVKHTPGNSSGALEFTISRASGNDAGVDYSVVEAAASGRLRTVREKWNLDWFFGLGYIDLDLEAGGLNRSFSVPGLFAGLQFDWKATRRLTPYARYSILGGFLTSRPVSVSQQVEIGVSYAITENVRLLGGYRFWSFRAEFTDVDLEIHGFVLGVEFKF